MTASARTFSPAMRSKGYARTVRESPRAFASERAVDDDVDARERVFERETLLDLRFIEVLRDVRVFGQ
jgi:hypothetical protein